MSSVLFIYANPKPVDQSFTLTAAAAFKAAYEKEKPQDRIIELDLFHTDIPFIDGDVLSGWGKLAQGLAIEGEELRKVSRINELTDQFVQADKFVFVSPLWNFGVPAILKAYIDTIVIQGKTFTYTSEGPKGLLAGKQAIHIQASGSVFSEGPFQSFEHGTSHLRSVLTFLGLSVESVLIEGVASTQVNTDEIRDAAINKLIALLPKFAE